MLIYNRPFTWIERMCCNIIKAGHVPKHIAFIMDGNRRYSEELKIKKSEAISKGFEKLSQTVRWCAELEIKEVTVYAFSIANLQRDEEEEVDDMMKLFQMTLERILIEKDEIMLLGVCIRVIGNLSLLPPEIRKLVAEVMLLTENNTRLILNIAFSYSSREEITNSIKCVVEGVNSGLLELQDINEELLSNCMYNNKSPDLVIRTSGVHRFSDFMLWQISCSQVIFANSKVFWPKLSMLSLLGAIFIYQANYNNMLSVKKTKASLNQQYVHSNQRVTKFIDHLNQYRRKQLETYLNE